VLANTFYLYYPSHGVYKSSNGGASWTLVYSGNDGFGTQWNGYITPFNWYNNELMSVPDQAGNIFFTGGHQGGDPTYNPFMRSTDGGATWTQTYTNDPNNPEAADTLPLGGIKADLVPLNMQTAWVGGVTYSPGTIYLYRTDDGGHTWAPVTPELPDGAENFEFGIDREQMQFVSATDGFLIVRMSGDSTQTAVYVTRDGGDTWTLTPTLIPEAGASDILSADEVIIYNGEQFYVTHDAARTWATITPDIVFGDSFVTMDFIDPNSGWIVILDANDHRSLYRTHDGGVTWSPAAP